MEERLQKLFSKAGLCSRRAAETYIEAGRVQVNGTTAHLGTRADPNRDRITLDGTPVRIGGQLVYLMLNKPRGYVTTLSDEQGRKTVRELTADCGVRIWPVGRLDLDSEGLLLLTNDGELTERLTHPRHQVEKEYLVRVEGDMSRGIPLLKSSMTLDGVPLSPAKVERLGDTLLSITIREGKNRQVRRMCAQAGLRVKMLRRIREGPVLLGPLRPGQWRYLTREEQEALLAL